jgi:tetratricopeptide (TPR) repeat protein
LQPQAGDLAGAQEDLERAQALLPGNTDLALRQAAVLERQGRLREALALYGQAIVVSAAPAELYLHAGKLRYNLGQYRRALANFQAALERKPGNGPAYGGIGLSQRQLGNTAAALVAFKEYLRLEPAAPDRAEIAAWVRKHGG